MVIPDSQLLPLRATSLRVDARGGIARTVLEQRFVNPHAETLAVTYRMPLPADGAVSGYAFRVGERRIVGEIDRREAARARFEQAIVEGHGAALLEQERSSLFTQEIHGIAPGAEIVAEITIDQRLTWLDEGAWEWRFPTAAAPRYLGSPGRVADAERVTFEVVDAPLAAGFSLALAVRDTLAQGQRPASPSHALACAEIGGCPRVALSEREAPLDRDVVVRWPVAGPAASVTLDVARPESPASAAFALLTLVPPLPARRPAPVPRDVVILLDESGSMRGDPLAQAQRVCAALVDGLGADDTLEMIAFAATEARFRGEPTRATPEMKREALAWIFARAAGGGTEMGAGIRAALAGARPLAQRQVVVVSDGLIGFEQETLADVLASLPERSRLHTVGIGSAVNRSFTAAAARAGRGVELIVGLGEDPERAARQLLARTEAPLIVDLTITGSALEVLAPSRLPDLFAGAPVLVAARVQAGGGELTVRGRTAAGLWEQTVRVPRIEPGTGHQAAVALFGREAVEDAEMRLSAGEDARAVDPVIERLGLDFQIATRLTSWVAVDTRTAVDPSARVRRVRVPQMLPYGLSADAFGLREVAVQARPARPARQAGDFDEKTRVTRVVTQPPPLATGAPGGTDCMVVIYTKEPTLLGKRFVLEQEPHRIGRGAGAHIVLDGDSISRRHARVEQRGAARVLVDEGSTNGTYCNDERVQREVTLKNGDRIAIGTTIFKFLSGSDVEAQYHEEIYRMTILDGLTQLHNKRYLREALEREIVRVRRRGHTLAFLMFDIDHFKRINDTHGHLAGDLVLRELARLVATRVRRDELLARYGGEEFAIVLPETSLSDARVLAEALRQQVKEHVFTFQGDVLRVTISLGAASLREDDATVDDLIKRADERLYAAKKAGRDRVCS